MSATRSLLMLPKNRLLLFVFLYIIVIIALKDVSMWQRYIIMIM